MTNNEDTLRKGKRPGEVTWLGVASIIIGTKMAILGISALQVIAVIPPSTADGIADLFASALLIAILQSPISFFGAIAGVGLLCRQEAARITLQGVNWIMLVLGLLIMMRLLFLATAYFSRVGWDAKGVLAMLIGFVGAMVILSIPVVFISYLQSNPVKEAMRRDR